MSKAAVVYQLEGQLYAAGLWIPLGKTYQGPPARSRAICHGEELSTWPTYYALRVMKSGEADPVWSWERKARVI